MRWPESTFDFPETRQFEHSLTTVALLAAALWFLEPVLALLGAAVLFAAVPPLRQAPAWLRAQLRGGRGKATPGPGAAGGPGGPGGSGGPDGPGDDDRDDDSPGRDAA